MKTPLRVVCVVLTALSLSTAACGGITSLFATPTPTPTLTPTPTPTPIPTATPTSTPTPLPTGVHSEKQSDGSIRVVDYDNKYQASIQSGWSVVPLGGKDIAKTLQDLSKQNPDLGASAEAFAQLDPNAIRLVAFNDDPKYIVNGFATVIVFMAVQDALADSVSSAVLFEAMKQGLQQQGMKILSSRTEKNAHAQDYLLIEGQQTSPTATGAKIPVRTTIAIFKVKGGVVMIMSATPKQFGDELASVIAKVAQTFSLTSP